jgi:CRP/FNR family cyclic AMP-dependent transcriptional regulator
MDDLERSLSTHPFLQGLDPEHIRFLVGCTKNVRYGAGDYLMREGEREDTLHLIRQGTVSIETPAARGEPVVLETVGPGDVLGVSCLTPWAAHLDSRAREAVLAFAIDNRCLLRKMEDDARFGFAVSMKLLERTYRRLDRARLQSLDVYR